MQQTPLAFETDGGFLLEFWKWLLPAAGAALLFVARWLWNIGRGHWARMSTVDAIAADVAEIKSSLAELVTQARYTKARIEARDENDSIAHYRADAEGRCIWVNQAYSDLVGRAREELLGEGWRKILSPADRDRAVKEWLEAIEGVTELTVDHGLEYRSSFKILRPGGELIDCQSIAFPIFQAGEALEWVGSIKRL